MKTKNLLAVDTPKKNGSKMFSTQDETRRNLRISVLKESNGPGGRGERHEVLWPGLET